MGLGLVDVDINADAFVVEVHVFVGEDEERVFFVLCDVGSHVFTLEGQLLSSGFEQRLFGRFDFAPALTIEVKSPIAAVSSALVVVDDQARLELEGREAGKGRPAFPTVHVHLDDSLLRFAG
ncbi:MAG: hypothetical protein R8J94_20750 [Acidimicrobiia bacterium]|nr:hypothetical protein [Acidimicrobiia bacterium]